MGLLVRNAVDGMGQTLVFFPAFVMSGTGMAQQKGRKSHHPEKKGTSGMPRCIPQWVQAWAPVRGLNPCGSAYGGRRRPLAGAEIRLGCRFCTDNHHGLKVIYLMTGMVPALPAQRRDRRLIRAFARLTAGQCPLPGRAAAPGGCPMVPGILTKLYIARMEKLQKAQTGFTALLHNGSSQARQPVGRR